MGRQTEVMPCNFPASNYTSSRKTKASSSRKGKDPASAHKQQKRKQVSTIAKARNAYNSQSAKTVPNTLTSFTQSPVAIHIQFDDPGPLYIDLYSRNNGTGAFIKSFRKKPDGGTAKAENCGLVELHDELAVLNGTNLSLLPFTDIIEFIRAAQFPIAVTFHRWKTNEAGSIMNDASPTRTKQSRFSGSWKNSFGTKSEGNIRKKSWSIDDVQPFEKVRQVRKEGVKTFLRKIGAMQRKTSNRAVDQIQFLLENFYIEGEKHDLSNDEIGDDDCKETIKSIVYHSTPVVLKMKQHAESLLGDESIYSIFSFQWYRKTKNEEVVEIRGARNNLYAPNADDVGCSLSCKIAFNQCSELYRVLDTPFSLTMDPSISDTVQMLYEASFGAFSATLASSNVDHFQVKISRNDGVTLARVSEHEEDAGIVVSVPFHRHLQVLLDPYNSCSFVLKVQELGNFLGHDDGEICDMSKPKRAFLQTISCFFLIAPNSEHRDIIAALIRRLRADKISEEEEWKAQHDELNLYMDPASVACVSGDPTLDETKITHRCNENIASNEDDSNGALCDFFGLSLSSEATETLDTHHISALDANASNGMFTKGRIWHLQTEKYTLQDKLTSLSVILKTTEKENEMLKAVADIKDERIEGLQLRLYQMDKQIKDFSEQLVHASTSYKSLLLQKAQCEKDLLDANKRLCAVQSVNASLAHSNTLEGNLLKDKEITALHIRIQTQNHELDCLRSVNGELLTEKNAVVARNKSLSIELKHVLSQYQALYLMNNKVQDCEKVLQELEIARKDLKQVQEKTRECQMALDSSNIIKTRTSFGNECDEKSFAGNSATHLWNEMVTSPLDRKRRSTLLCKQNKALQRLVAELTDALQEQKEQMEATKNISAGLASIVKERGLENRRDASESSAVEDAIFSEEEDALYDEGSKS